MKKRLQEEKYISPLREKYWCELKANEKIERLRHILKREIANIRYILNMIEKLKTHKHNTEGMPIVEEKLGDNCGGEAAAPLSEAEMKNEVYF